MKSRPGKLSELPSSDDKFWKGARKELIKPEEGECVHFFVPKSANEVECENCRIGYFLGTDDELVEGHIYHKKQLVV